MKKKIYNVMVMGCMLKRQYIARSATLAKFNIEFSKRRAIKEAEVLQEVCQRHPELVENSTAWDVVEVEYRCNGLLNTAKFIHMGGRVSQMN